MTETDRTIPEPEYAGGNDLVTVTMTKNQVALIVVCLMEQSKLMPIAEQMEWSRLAIGLNDLIAPPQEVDESHGGAEPG